MSASSDRLREIPLFLRSDPPATDVLRVDPTVPFSTLAHALVSAGLMLKNDGRGHLVITASTVD